MAIVINSNVSNALICQNREQLMPDWSFHCTLSNAASPPLVGRGAMTNYGNTLNETREGGRLRSATAARHLMTPAAGSLLLRYARHL